ncbi:SIR2 family NAD-dependent protein deacylase [Clostridium cibarium]|uniref:SIR2 family protein n=1 Tax=Clostridium cibarium TaxID=2762247 RepID=A0ABR8PV49_9CLOT|nr:SIR2 family protein [Clostridium cibarium]MBD7912057.1 SIR2 family protein [Clostridium cibarium]
MNFEDIMAFNAPYNQRNIDSLIEKIRSSSIVPYVGAGMSMLFENVYPSWSGFLNRTFTEFIDVSEKNKFDNLSYEDKADFLYAEMGQRTFADYLKDTFGQKHLDRNFLDFVDKPINLLPIIFEKGLIITTNYDKVIEKVYGLHDMVLSVAHPGHFEALNGALRDGELLLYKIHGDITEPIKSIILTKEQYELAYSNPNLIQALKQAYISKAILFLGCSIEKDRPIELLCEVSQAGMNNYAIVGCKHEGAKERRLQLENEYYTQAIIYPDGKHECINIILDYIAKNTNQKTYQKFRDKFYDKSKIVGMKLELSDELLVNKLLPVSCVDLPYLKDMIKTSIDNLQVRFNKEFNVDVELSNWLSKFCIIEDEKRNLYLSLKEVKNAISRFNVNVNLDISNKLNFLIEDLLENREFDSFLLEKDMIDFIDEVECENRKKYTNSEKDYYNSNDYYDWRNLCVKNGYLDNYRKAFCADSLVITGEAGIGKSHSIAHFVYNMFYLKNQICIFILGQHLNNDLDPVLMLEKYLHIPYTLQRFLEELNKIAEDNNCIIPFIIEGINEGHHSEVWKEYFEGLIGIFENYNRIKLIISIRETYIKKCLPENYKKRDKTLVIKHRGFAEDSSQAVADFFDYYGIDKPTFPILYSNFYNPLFLHTLCKTVSASGNVKIEEYSSFNEIFGGYLEVVEKSISERCKYQKGLKLVKKSVDKIIEYSLENDARYGITISTFYEIVAAVVEKFGVSLVDFIQAMIENGLFYTELYGYPSQEEYIQFAYERYHNILAAQYLLSNINTKEELNDSILNGELSKYFIKIHSGIIEEFFVLIPEEFELELLEILDEETAEKVLDQFLNSLVWRKKTSISLETTISMINKYIIVSPWYFKKLIEKQLIIAPIEGHPLNALLLHEYLNKHSMAVRDSFWVECLYDDTTYGSGILNTLVRLCRSQLEEYTREVKELIIILLVWSLASTNNSYRENAIWSLVALIQDNLLVAAEIIKRFKQVNDGYVKEGLYCSVYGAVLRSQNLIGAKELAEEVYVDIFDRNEVYPHIIIRAHAKGIIDYLIQSIGECNFDIEKTIPPYNSKWYAQIPCQEEIDKYLVDYKDENVKSYMYSINTIIHSMATNTGENSIGYGDFGRYIFEGWVYPWKYHFIAQDLSNIVTKQIFETYGYNYNLHGKFDGKVKSYDRHAHSNERIGKKYQRIASFEMLARLADNFKPGEVKREYSKAYKGLHSKRLKEILKLYNNSDDLLDLENEEYDELEDDVKETFIPYEYTGPWQFGYRGVDPTLLTLKPSKEKNLWNDVFKIPNVQNEVWASEKSEEPTIDKILFVEYNDESFVTLEMYNTWESDCLRYDEEPKKYFAKAIAVLVPNDVSILNTAEKTELKKFAEGRNNYNVNDVFSREYFWSDAYKGFELEVARDYDEDKFIQTGIDYNNPTPFSESREDVISSYAMPSKFLVEYFELSQLYDGKWYDKSGELVCLDIVFDGYKRALLIRKERLIELIKKKNFTVAWGIYTEKKGKPNYYATRKIVEWDGNEINVEEFDTEQWKARFF